jgi:hypothetical protein
MVVVLLFLLISFGILACLDYPNMRLSTRGQSGIGAKLQYVEDIVRIYTSLY